MRRLFITLPAPLTSPFPFLLPPWADSLSSTASRCSAFSGWKVSRYKSTRRKQTAWANFSSGTNEKVFTHTAESRPDVRHAMHGAIPPSPVCTSRLPVGSDCAGRVPEDQDGDCGNLNHHRSFQTERCRKKLNPQALRTDPAAQHAVWRWTAWRCGSNQDLTSSLKLVWKEKYQLIGQITKKAGMFTSEKAAPA